MLHLRSACAALFVLVCAASVTVACDDDDGDESESGQEHGMEPLVCAEISDACHDLDDGTNMAHDCHLTAHEGDAAACEMVRDACLAFCTSSESSGGSSSSSG